MMSKIHKAMGWQLSRTGAIVCGVILVVLGCVSALFSSLGGWPILSLPSVGFIIVGMMTIAINIFGEWGIYK